MKWFLNLIPGFATVKTAVIVGVVALVVGFVGKIVWDNHSLRKDNAALVQREGSLSTSLTVEKATVKDLVGVAAEWKRDFDRLQERLVDQAADRKKVEEDLHAIDTRFAAPHADTVAAERAVNGDIADLLGVFERAAAGNRLGTGGSGSPDRPAPAPAPRPR